MSDLREKIADICDAEIQSDHPSCYVLADAIIAALPSMVKPLEWVDLHGDGSLYQTSNENPIDYHAVINSRGRSGFWYFGLYGTLEAAKEAAQADYKRRILSALDLAPITPAQAVDVLLPLVTDDVADELRAIAEGGA
jgi:hypothetical protein